MAIHDFNAERLFLDAPLAAGVRIDASPEQANYLLNVLRLTAGAKILTFNGRDGEWRAELSGVTKRSCCLIAIEQTRMQTSGPDIDYLFAPLKRSRLDYMVQKAAEMGVRRLRPVITHRTIAERVNIERMRANAIEAAEQCGILAVPEVSEPEKLDRIMSTWGESRHLIFCDEEAETANPLTLLSALEPGPVAVLVGPEGGFDAEERRLLRAKSFATGISLGPRILRADTAAVAALALVNTVLGDWR
jgi:16S rRNA (uracil1498-N3)-methyltransferase